MLILATASTLKVCIIQQTSFSTLTREMFTKRLRSTFTVLRHNGLKQLRSFTETHCWAGSGCPFRALV